MCLSASRKSIVRGCLAVAAILVGCEIFWKFFAMRDDGLAPQEIPLSSKVHSREAYVTLQYGDHYKYQLGTRVLGQSLVDTGTTKDRVVLCTDAVQDETKQALQADGWIVKSISRIFNPYGGRSYLVYSKLHAWNLTEYERVAFLDSDILVLSNIDRIFDCGTFCASYRHSDKFNSGVMVIEPSTSVFTDMLKHIAVVPSYDNGDQGFLNGYYKDLIYAPFLNWSGSERHHHYARLEWRLNANVANYYSNMAMWKSRESELKAIHFTMGKVKPWCWWSHRLFDMSWNWTRVRMRLPRQGYTPGLPFQALYWVPYLLLYCFFATLRHLCPTWNVCSRRVQKFNRKYSHLVPLSIIVSSYYISFYYIVPTAMLPAQAEYVLWLWSTCFMILFMGTYCCLCHSADKPTPRESSKRFLITLLLFLVFSASHAMQAMIPSLVSLFWRRVAVFFSLTAVHLLLGHVIGQEVIRMWTKC